ncbi:MAG TPA: GNAT family N-acetyltransferase [Ornithinimicrobium sp.]|uniref:GNAT family N-acetyltransferase n=1 Tax=Ornithinimicrobium sp. TaxID=1977084 RepID=UPI002B469BFD|nr:GNAT family N-acetyltransferase [Ornithinimicrobium sp.]HKJ12086.1 GNAT family N-acetyltransferase [Ornithinimicrobium sp.]
MAEISVRRLGEEDWAEYRRTRLRALKESPEAFVASAEEEAEYGDERWRDRMRRSHRLLAQRDGDPLGVVSVGSEHTADESVGELFGLWVSPDARGTGVARRLLEAAARTARESQMRHLVYWVGTDNGRAVAFASSFGFRPTDNRRPVRIRGVDTEEEDAEEMAMVLPLSSSTGEIPTSL